MLEFVGLKLYFCMLFSCLHGNVEISAVVVATEMDSKELSILQRDGHVLNIVCVL